MTHERRLISNALVAMLNVIVGSVLLFLLYRSLLHQLGPETLGVWSLLVASIGVARLSDLGMAASATRFVAAARATGDDRQAGHVAETSTVTLLIVGVLAAGIALTFLPQLLAGFLPASQLDAARRALPFALCAFAIGLAGATVQSALDGCQRVDLRVWVSLTGQAVLLVAAIFWAGPYGLVGVAAAQMLQSLVVLIGSWVLLRQQLGSLPVLPYRWHRATFRRILGYSAVFQLNGVFIVIADPLVKFMLTHFGGLSATAYFDMAMQLVQKLRQLPISATQVLVPAMAQASELGQDQVRQLYSRSYRTIFAATVPIFGLAAVLVSVISILWIGHLEPLFAGMAWVCVIGLAVNTIGIPSYYSNLGTGHVGTNATGHALTALLLVILGWWGGTLWGAVGVCVGYATAVAAGGLYVQVTLMKRLRLEMPSILPVESRRLLLISIIAVALCLAADAALLRFPYFRLLDPDAQLVRASLLIAAFVLLTGFSMWSHPLRRTIASRVMEAVH